MFDFDSIHDRRTSGDIKYEPIKGIDDVIPMWVADMDFKTAPCVEESVKKVAGKAIYGYQGVDEEYLRIVQSWYSRRFDFATEDDWILPSPAVMYSIACAIRALTKENDAVLIFEPVYYPFKKAVIANHRRPIVSEPLNNDGHYEIDFDDFEHKVTKSIFGGSSDCCAIRTLRCIPTSIVSGNRISSVSAGSTTRVISTLQNAVTTAIFCPMTVSNKRSP